MSALDEASDSARVEGIKEQLLQAAGGSYSALEAAAILGIPERSLRQHVRRGTLLGLRFRDHLCIPACQIQNGHVASGLK